MYSRSILSIVHLLVAFLSTADAFSAQPTQCRRSMIPTTTSLFMSEEGEASTTAEAVESAAVSEEPPKPAVKCPDCDLCDGSGRILGGIGVVLDWWPIKAYRPCPNFVERGGNYVRAGQGLDEIAFGRDSTFEVK